MWARPRISRLGRRPLAVQLRQLDQISQHRVDDWYSIFPRVVSKPPQFIIALELIGSDFSIYGESKPPSCRSVVATGNRTCTRGRKLERGLYNVLPPQPQLDQGNNPVGLPVPG